MKLSADPLDFSPPRDARWRGPLLLALGVHALLIAALTWGVSWQQDAPAAAVAAELWAALPAAAAPRAVEPEAVAPPPKPEPEPVPTRKVEPVKPPVTQAVEKPAPKVDAGPSQAQIALQRKKEEENRRQQELEHQRELELKKKEDLKKKEELRKKEDARKEAELKEAERKKREAEDKQAREREQAKLDKARQDKLKKEEERKKHEAEEKKREEQAAREKAEQAAKDKAAKEKAAREKAAHDKAEAARIEGERKKQLARMMGQAGGSGDAGAKGSGSGGSASGSAGGAANGAGGSSSGSGAGGSGASAGYAAKVAARIKTFYNAPEQFPSHLTAEAEIRTLPDGTILNHKLLKSSGNPAFDETVMRAIDRAGRLPKDDNGRMPDTTFVIKFKP